MNSSPKKQKRNLQKKRLFLKGKNMLKSFCVMLITLYQKTFSRFHQRCRFYPTCSEYTKQAIQIHGVFYGIYLGILRILKCHPFHEGGFDPVPPLKKRK
ncbi:MAG: membrane protein insertion efficiency factor YidD [Alphaproteobacteria bacterium]|nr:membrane protein insertion efficiency factor YidD [Alphaproteobacteria bacterium]